MTKTQREKQLRAMQQAVAAGLVPGVKPTAVIYVRVSTREQAEMGGDPEGFSIPAQREGCLRKAEAIGAVVAAEFVDRGESAKTANRPELQKMLTYVKEHAVAFVIVHKVDRLARSRADDVTINIALQESGVQLVSCTESIDETPSGKLLHGIMATIAEFYSRNLAAEVMKGSVQKAKGGGTPTKAPLGYLNVRQLENGREHRTVIIDPERAALLRFAFQAYATGEWTIRGLLNELTKRGLTTRPGPRKPEGPLAMSQLHRLLTNPYFVGIVTYRGIEYPGRHEPLVDRPTFQRVQSVLDSHNVAGVKNRKFPHYLKGTVFCADCGNRLSVANNKGRSGTVYPYFYCLGRQRDPSSCNQKVILIDVAEEMVLEHYRSGKLSTAWADSLRLYLREELTTVQEEANIERVFQTKRVGELKSQQLKLIQMGYAEAIPLELLRSEQQRISQELMQSEERLQAVDLKFETIEANLDRALLMVTDCFRAYESASTLPRRHYNQAFFEWIKIGRRGITDVELAAPFNILLGDELEARRRAKGKQVTGKTTVQGANHEEPGSPAVVAMTGTDGQVFNMTTGDGQIDPGAVGAISVTNRAGGRSRAIREAGNRKTRTNFFGAGSSESLLVGEGGLEPP